MVLFITLLRKGLTKEINGDGSSLVGSCFLPVCQNGSLKGVIDSKALKQTTGFARLKMCRLQDSALLLKFTDVPILMSFFMSFIFWVIEDL